MANVLAGCGRASRVVSQRVVTRVVCGVAVCVPHRAVPGGRATTAVRAVTSVTGGRFSSSVLARVNRLAVPYAVSNANILYIMRCAANFSALLLHGSTLDCLVSAWTEALRQTPECTLVEAYLAYLYALYGGYALS